MPTDAITDGRSYLVHIGCDTPDALGWQRRLEQLATIVSYPCLTSALAQPPERAPRVTLLVQRHPDAWDSRQLIAWRRLFPLTRCLVLRAPWVAGRSAADRDSDGFRSFRWDESSELLHAATIYLHHARDVNGHRGNVPDDTGPRSATPDRHGVFRPTVSVLIRSPVAEMEDAIGAAVRQAGWPCIANLPVASSAQETTIGIFDEADRVSWSNEREWLACQRRIGLASFLRPHERWPMQQNGFDELVSKPFKLDQLLRIVRSLATVSQRRQVQQSATRIGR